MTSAEARWKGTTHVLLKLSSKVTYPSSAAQDLTAPAQPLESSLMPRDPASLLRLETWLPLSLEFHQCLSTYPSNSDTIRDPGTGLPRTLTWLVTQTERQGSATFSCPYGQGTGLTSVTRAVSHPSSPLRGC